MSDFHIEVKGRDRHMNKGYFPTKRQQKLTYMMRELFSWVPFGVKGRKEIT